MFENFREKIQTVQNDLSLGIRGLAISPETKEEIRNKLGFHKNVHKNKVNLNAGSDLLLRYQTQWQQMHEINVKNANFAENIAKNLNDIELNSKKQDLIINELLSQLSSLPQIIESIESIEKDLNKSKKYILQTERILTNLEDSKDDEEFNKLKTDQNFKVEVYKQNRESELEALRVKLAVEHTNRVQELERYQQNILKERQEAFQMAFDEEIKRYKTEGIIERKDLRTKELTKGTSIEEIVIEAEKSEEEALEEFLQD